MTVCPNVLSGNSDITLLLFRRKIPLHVFGCVHRTGALHFLLFPRWITVTLCCRHLRLEQRLHVLRQRRNVSRPARGSCSLINPCVLGALGTRSEQSVARQSLLDTCPTLLWRGRKACAFRSSHLSRSRRSSMSKCARPNATAVMTRLRLPTPPRARTGWSCWPRRHRRRKNG